MFKERWKNSIESYSDVYEVYQRLKGVISEKKFLERVLDLVTKRDGC
jgi:hypothetical protein